MTQQVAPLDYLIPHNYKRELDVLLDVGVVQELVFPHLQVPKAVFVVDRVRQYADVAASVEGRSECLESLLSRRVPNLQGVGFAVDLDVFVQELHSYRVERVLVELVRDESVHEAALAHAAVPQYDDFEERVLVCWAHVDSRSHRDYCNIINLRWTSLQVINKDFTQVSHH
jgi:hypothetical protein